MTVYALLDFDGYICKAFWAANSKKGSDKNANEILEALYWSAIEKTAKYFDATEDEVTPLLFVSAHSWKKDVFPTYKVHRKKNEELGKFRDEIIANDEDIIKIEQLEADEVILIAKDYIVTQGDKYVIFSDDKDLKYYTELYCKINLSEEIKLVDDATNYHNRFAQMLAGDKEDNIAGIPKVGMVTANKLIENKLKRSNYPYVKLIDIIEIYKNKNISYLDCIEQLAQIIPAGYFTCASSQHSLILAEAIINKEHYLLDDVIVQDMIETTLEYIKDVADLVYG